jgi:hypothetical protein
MSGLSSPDSTEPFGSALRRHWTLDPDITYIERLQHAVSALPNA